LVAEPPFDGDPLAYHVVGFLIHCAAIVLVWLLALRLTARWEAAAAASVVFALHPAGFESVAWISSALNSVALPLALAGWLVFVAAVRTHSESRADQAAGTSVRLHVASVTLFALALLFRETAAVVLAGMVLWYLLCCLTPAVLRAKPNSTPFQASKPRRLLRPWHALAPLVPYALLLLAYQLARTEMFTQGAPGGEKVAIDRDLVGQAWYYVKQGPLPMDNVGPQLAWAQRAGGLVLLAGLAVAAGFRRWLLVAFGVAFLVATLPYAALQFGVARRYFYFPSAFFALAMGVAFTEVLDLLRRYAGPRTRNAIATVSLVTLLVALPIVGNLRVREWARLNPDVNQAWVEGLEQAVPDLPQGGTLYLVNVPFVLVPFGPFLLEPMVTYVYGHPPGRIELIPTERLAALERDLGPNDRLYVHHPN
jgi:hypothetical protein